MAGSAALFLLTALCALLPAECDIFSFDNEAVPGPYTLNALYLFYAHVKGDTPSGAHRAKVSFKDLSLHPKSGANLEDYVSVQVGIVPWGDLFDVLVKEELCMPQGEGSSNTLKLQDVEAKQHVRLHTVQGHTKHGHTKHKESFDLEASGAYVLVVANCGEEEDIHISGSISIQNPYGYLPGNEYFKLPLYGWSVLIWVAVLLAWAAQLYMNKDKLFYVQYGLLGIICVGLVESALWLLHLTQINKYGEFSSTVAWAEVFSVVKNCYLMLLFCLVAVGVGVTYDQVQPDTKYKMMSIATLYTLADLPKVYVFSLRHRHGLEDTVVYGLCVPVALVAVAVFVWILRAVASQMQRLRDAQEEESLLRCQRMASLCVMSFVTAFATVVLQLFDTPGADSTWWQFHMLCNDGISQVGSLVVVSGMMFLWAPRAGGFSTAYIAPGGENIGKETEGLTTGDASDTQEDGGDGEVQQAEEDGKLGADTIGAPAFGRAVE